MNDDEIKGIKLRLRAVEDQLEIYQIVCSYGYAMDGLNAEAVAAIYSEDGVYAVADLETFTGRAKIAGITRRRTHLSYVEGGCAHTSTLPYVVVNGDKASATCHTALLRYSRDRGFHVFRASASRLELSRGADGRWQIDHRQNYLLDGAPEGPALLARLNEVPGHVRS